MASEVDRTQPGSKNDWRITYDTGSQKWTDDRPGDGVGPNSGRQLKETLDDPAVQRGLTAIQKAIEGKGDVEKAIGGLVRDMGTEKAKTVLNAVYKASKGSKQEKAWDEARQMVAGIRDVVKRIFDVFNVDKAKEVAERVVDYWKTKNQKSDLAPDEQRRIYRPVDFGEILPLTKKRKLDIGWTDHAEYRSELRDVDHREVNERIRDRLREKLNPPQKKKMKFKEPGLGTMVVDFNTMKNPAEADVITVWGSVQDRVARRFMAAVMDRVDPNAIPILWYENEGGDKFIPDMSGNTEPQTPPDGFKYQHSQFSDLRHSILEIVQQEDVDACDHPSKHRKMDLGLDPAYGEAEECRKCGGYRKKPVGGKWGPWEATGSREIMVMNSGWPEDLALAIANSNIRLSKAIQIAATACERCMNALAYEFGLDWGYPEMSEEWKKCGTECDFCRDMDHNKVSNKRTDMNRKASERDEIVKQLYYSTDKGIKEFSRLLYSIWNIGKADWKAAKKEMQKYPSGRKVIKQMEALPYFEEISKDDGGYWRVMKPMSREERVPIDKEWEELERKQLRPLEHEMVDYYLEHDIPAAKKAGIADRVARRAVGAAVTLTGEKTGRDAVTLWYRFVSLSQRLGKREVVSDMAALDRKAAFQSSKWHGIAELDGMFLDDEPYIEAEKGKVVFVKRVTVLFKYPDQRDFFIKEVEVR